MKRLSLFLFIVSVATCLWLVTGDMRAENTAANSPEWSINSTVIEACSCPMFCQCYFNSMPAHHTESGGAHYCKFNNAYKINKGKFGATDLAGAKFWIYGDLGGDFSKGQMDWGVLTFDKATSKAQRDAIGTIAGKLFPVKWNSFQTAEGSIDTWEFNNDAAHATLDGGKTAEVKLKRFQGMTNEPVVIKNLKYWGAPRNEGFVLMPNEVNAYRGKNGYETKNGNGFMLTLDMNSKDTM